MNLKDLENKIESAQSEFLTRVDAARAQRSAEALTNTGGTKIERFAFDSQPRGFNDLTRNAAGSPSPSSYDGGSIVID